jgi:hypothetical protein
MKPGLSPLSDHAPLVLDIAFGMAATPLGMNKEVETQNPVGVATLERRSKRQDIGDADLVRCGIASSDQSRLRGRWL